MKPLPMFKRRPNEGIRTGFEMALRFVKWAGRQRVELTWEMIADEFQVSRATAFRWLSAYKEQYGVVYGVGR